VEICSESIKVQDILIRPNNTEYTRKVWKTLDGQLIRAKWPEHIDGQFGFHLKSYIISLYFDSHMTQPSILRHLTEVGINISSGEIHNTLVENKGLFHKEKENILKVGLRISRSITTDDTGLRHRGANGYCTHIGNEFFAYFKSSNSKSRINFMEILRGKDTGYLISGYSVDYYKNQKLSENTLRILSASKGREFKNKSEWEKYLKILGIRDDFSARKATEGALLGVIMKKIKTGLAIVSDDAGQFDILRHGLCWVHSERCITSLHCVSYDQDQLIKDILEKYWGLFRRLHEYKRNPTNGSRKKINADFDDLFTMKTEMLSLNKALASLFKKKRELLLVLEEPEIPLTNNISEGDIRDQAKKRKISAGTRSEAGRKARDTFMSLQKTCKKLGISFHDYLHDRLSGANQIPYMTKLMKTKARIIYKALPDYYYVFSSKGLGFNFLCKAI
jgi:hypothetical protein